MKTAAACIAFALLTTTQYAQAGNAYQCDPTTPVDSLHNRSGWYIGEFTPQTGSYSGTIGSSQSLQVSANALINTAVAPHQWTQLANGDGTATLATGQVNLSSGITPTVNANLVGLNTQAPPWQTGAGDTQWPPSVQQGAMHGLIIQRNHLKSSAGSARRSHALDFARDYLEYRLVNSTDTTVDGTSRGQLVLGGETLEVEIVTEYLAPDGWGDNDYCWRLFNNNNGFKGFEVQLRPVVYILGQNLSLIADIPDIAGEYTGQIELAYDALPTSRPVY